MLRRRTRAPGWNVGKIRVSYQVELSLFRGFHVSLILAIRMCVLCLTIHARDTEQHTLMRTCVSPMHMYKHNGYWLFKDCFQKCSSHCFSKYLIVTCDQMSMECEYKNLAGVSVWTVKLRSTCNRTKIITLKELGFVPSCGIYIRIHTLFPAVVYTYESTPCSQLWYIHTNPHLKIVKMKNDFISISVIPH